MMLDGTQEEHLGQFLYKIWPNSTRNLIKQQNEEIVQKNLFW